MLHVRATRSLHRVEVAVDDTVQVLRDNLRGFVKLLVVERLCLLVDVLGEGDRREVTHRCLIFVGVLQDFCAKIGTLDDSQVLLVRLGVTRILVEHVGCTSLCLRLENRLPHIGSGDSGVGTTLLLVLGIQRLKLLTIAIRETWSLVRAEERPIATRLDPLHEKVRNPKGGEKVSATSLLVTLVESQFKEVHDIRVPWLLIHGDRTFTTTSLVHIACRSVEDPKHWDDTIGLTVCTSDTGLVTTNVVDVHSDTTRPFTDLRTLGKSSIDSVDRILLTSDEEARGHLGSGCSSVEKGWCGVNEIALRHLVVRLDDRGGISSMDTDGDAHKHVLWS